MTPICCCVTKQHFVKRDDLHFRCLKICNLLLCNKTTFSKQRWIAFQVPKDLWPVGPFGNFDSTTTRRYGRRWESSRKSRFNASRVRQTCSGKLDHFWHTARARIWNIWLLNSFDYWWRVQPTSIWELTKYSRHSVNGPSVNGNIQLPDFY